MRQYRHIVHQRTLWEAEAHSSPSLSPGLWLANGFEMTASLTRSSHAHSVTFSNANKPAYAGG